MSALRAALIVGDRYEVLRPLGAGSFGEVWSARDRASGDDVALKIMHPKLVDAPEAQRRFAIEARALTLIRHPNVVARLDEGTLDGRPWLALELLRGASLREWLRRHRDARRWTALPEVRQVFAELCAGVGAAHRAPGGPVVHRDIKLANALFSDPDPARASVKLIDFGVAQLREAGASEAHAHTASGMTLGSMHTMAPEQAAGRVGEVGPWTDVFALGVVLVELLTLRAVPPTGVWWWGIAVNDERAIAATLPSLRADVPRAWWDVAARCLRALPAARFESAVAVGEAFALATAAPGALTAAPSSESPVIEEHTTSTVTRARGT